VVQSLSGDFRSAAAVSLLAAGCLDYFFTRPLFTFYMSNPLNILALVAFLITALVITRLVSLERQQANSSRLQKDRLDRLYRLSQQLLALEPEVKATAKFFEPFHTFFG